MHVRRMTLGRQFENEGNWKRCIQVLSGVGDYGT
jgi:hypothetical protein